MPSWKDEGYQSPPEVKTAVGHEVIYRAYGGRSKRLGNRFFTPCIKDTPIGYWTAELLRKELNAALWGDDFETIAKFQICRNVEYKLGSMAQDNRSGVRDGVYFEYHHFHNSPGIFKQVTFFKEEKSPWSHYVWDLNESFPAKGWDIVEAFPTRWDPG